MWLQGVASGELHRGRFRGGAHPLRQVLPNIGVASGPEGAGKINFKEAHLVAPCGGPLGDQLRRQDVGAPASLRTNPSTHNPLGCMRSSFCNRRAHAATAIMGSTGTMGRCSANSLEELLGIRAARPIF